LKKPRLSLTPDISAAEARRIVLKAQGLDRETPFGLGTKGALGAFERLGYVQIDTISVVERAHHHVLWSRVPDYKPELLHRLQAGDRLIFEYWSHAASYLPFADYRYCLPRMRAYSKGKRHWFARDRKSMAFVLDRIRAEGPLQARDFEAPPGKRSGPWFDWKPSKRALEQLFIQGELMIRERRGFQKVYDLPERVLPAGIDTSLPSAGEMARYLVRLQLRSHGLGLEPEMRYLRKNAQKAVSQALREMEEDGEIVRVRIEGGGEHFALKRALEEPLTAPGPDHVRILSPFDNLVIQRKRLKRLFGFDYQIECYVPEPKRKHGYFVLPVLRGDRLVARIDTKADREKRELRVLSQHFEESRERKAILAALGPELERFARFNGCEKVRPI
jgi:uncharacterized protein YcaQ